MTTQPRAITGTSLPETLLAPNELEPLPKSYYSTMTNNSSSVYVQRSDYNYEQSAQPEVDCVSITDTCYRFDGSSSYILI